VSGKRGEKVIEKRIEIVIENEVENEQAQPGRLGLS